MGRRLLVATVVVLVFIGAGAGVALLTRDDASDSSDSTAGTTSTSASTTSPPTTTAPATTTSAPTPTTAAVPPPAELPDPCGAEGAAIKAAIDNGIDGAAASAQVDQCRLAAVDPSWAVVLLAAKPGADFNAVTVLVHGGGGSWAIVGSGTNNVGCGSAPQQVLVDLGIVCSSAGGGGGQ